MTNNPSELARLEDELEYYRDLFKTKCNSKSAKENVLRKIRILEVQLGLDHKPYNGV